MNTTQHFFVPLLDFSEWDYPYPEKLWIRRPGWEMAVKVFFFIPIIVISLIGNGFVIYLMATTKFLRTSSTNLFLCNMACSDFLSSALFPWIVLCIDLYQHYILGSFICQTEGTLRVWLMLVSVLSLMAVSFDRFVKICLPSKPRVDELKTGFHISLSIKVVSSILVFIWIIALAIAAPIITSRSYLVRQWKDITEIYCQNDAVFSYYYYYVLNAVLIWLPLIIMLISYVQIFCTLKKPMCDTCTRTQMRQLAKRRRVSCMLFLMLLSFIVCWVPFTITIIISNTLNFSYTINGIPDWFPSMIFAARYLVNVNSAINPIIYGLTNENFRRAFYQKFPKLKAEASPGPSASTLHKTSFDNPLPEQSSKF